MIKYYATEEIAEKLRAKGYYREYCLTDEWVDGLFYQVEDGTFYLPRIDEVLAWLREEKKILVVAAPAFLYREARYFWQCGIYEISLLPNVIPFHKFIDNQESYESAILAGIEYCLDNFI